MKIVYFAHPVTHYGEYEEERALNLIMESFGAFSDGEEIEIFNPNQEWLQRLYNNRKKNNHPDRFSIFVEIVDACDIVVGSSYRDDMIGAGVAKELKKAYNNGNPTYIIMWEDCITIQKFIFEEFSDSILTIEETRERIKERII